MPTTKPKLLALIVWALAWAAAMIAAAILLKGNPIKDWVQAALFIAAMTFWVWQSERAARQ
jgi:Flp pilus assembly protein TadB